MEETLQFRVIVSDRARQMLASHIRFLAQKSPDAARQINHDLMKAIRSLSSMPGRFPFLNEEYIPPNKYHKMFVKKWYLVIYQVKDQMVLIDYIVDCRQDYGWLIQ